ncbi:DUF6768 family protein [Ekhidna sp. To15]|uniref:DUF6768 family protein n=1 Tax=Ekhidna sp. To15 TaxID=3395267 RepID=UPI003F51ECC7
MKTNNEIDQMIKEALSADELELFNTYEEQNVLQKFGGLFQGKMRWVNVMSVVFQLIIFGIAVYCGYRAFYAVDTTQMLQFGIGAFLAMMAVSFLKMYHFMEMNKNAVIRELKRVELQVSILANKLNAK